MSGREKAVVSCCLLHKDDVHRGLVAERELLSDRLDVEEPSDLAPQGLNHLQLTREEVLVGLAWVASPAGGGS